MLIIIIFYVILNIKVYLINNIIFFCKNYVLNHYFKLSKVANILKIFLIKLFKYISNIINIFKLINTINFYNFIK